MSANRLISQRALSIDASGIRKVFDLAAKMKDPINFSIGLPDFDVPEPAKLEAIDAIRRGDNRYTQTQGIAPLRERLRADLSREYGRDVGDVLITSGVSGGLLLTLSAVCDPGDEVIFLDPYFVMYKHLLSMINAKSVIVDSYPDFKFPADKVAAAITPRTKAIIVNSPSNPTGTLMSQQDVDAAVSLAKKHDLLILSDEIYEPFVYDEEVGSGQYAGAAVGSSDLHTAHRPLPTKLASALHAYEKTVVLRGFSKSHGMTGWRLGYAYGYEPVVAQMTKLQQYTYVCAPSAFQHAALKALDVPMTDAVAAYRKKRDLVYGMLSKKFEIVKPGGAFYIFPKVPTGNATDFVTRAIEKNVLIIPGNVFSGRDTHFRISYATTDEKIERGCEILNSLV
ncbi:MAG: aminotransferase class I/II-fold pyridoxal phosphate-dependent enzyme [Tepidisphaeraceae bacterium]